VQKRKRRQEKTRQTRQNKTRQDKTKQKKIQQNKTEQQITRGAVNAQRKESAPRSTRSAKNDDRSVDRVTFGEAENYPFFR